MKLLYLWTFAAHSDRQPDQSHAAERTEEGQAGGGGAGGRGGPGDGESGPSLIGKMALGSTGLLLSRNESCGSELGGRGHASSEAFSFHAPQPPTRLPR